MKKITILAGRNYRTKIFVNNRFVYSSSEHRETIRQDLKKLIEALELDEDEVEFVEEE